MPGWDQILKYILDIWRVVSEAPVAAILLVVVGWGIARWYYAGRLATAAERSKFDRDLVAEYKDKLKASSPDEAAKKYADLEQEVAALRALEDQRNQRRWPALTRAQIEHWVSLLAPHPVAFFATFYVDHNSEDFREGLHEVCEAIGWKGPVMSAGRLRGIAVRGFPSDPAALALIGLCKELGCSVEFHNDEQLSKPGERLQIFIGAWGT